VQHILPLGVSMAWQLTGQRLLLLTLVTAGCVFELRTTNPTTQDAPIKIRQILRQAGYTVGVRRQSWLGGEIAGEISIIAKHPACRESVVVTEVLLTVLPATTGSAPQLYIYDTWMGPLPSRLQILRIAAKLELGSFAAFGRVARPPRTMLAIRDPSACLALTSIPWRKFWRTA
jgi:hypothetical protein